MSGLARVIIVLSVLLTISYTSVVAQKETKPGLVLTGALERPPKLAFPLYYYENPKNSVYEVSVYMQMRNDTDEPVIIFRPGHFKGVKKIQFSSALRLSDRSIIGSSFELQWQFPTRFFRKEEKARVLPEFAEELSGDQPPTDEFAIIPPGGYFEFRDMFRIQFVDPEFDPDKATHESRRKYLATTPISDFPSFTVEYILSAKSLVPTDNDFLKDLQRRWRSIGNLVLNSSGDYSVRSDSIVGISVN